MELLIQGRNLELNESTREYITNKVNRMERHLPGISSARVELARETTRGRGASVVVQITLDIGGTVLRAEERAPSSTVAVDAVADVMDRRLDRYKGKFYRSSQAKRASRKGSPKTMEMPSIPPEEESPGVDVVEAEAKVVRVKRFPFKPMTVGDATFQMELLGHSFFLFHNSETDQPNVLYTRRDGDYGLIEPESL